MQMALKQSDRTSCEGLQLAPLLLQKATACDVQHRSAHMRSESCNRRSVQLMCTFLKSGTGFYVCKRRMTSSGCKKQKTDVDCST
jgi:hypothetical protein